MSTHSVTIPSAESVLSPVELTADVDGWPAGTAGTLVETFPHEGFVEIVDDAGRTLAIVTAPYTALRLHDAGR
jgi:hypothetical protein